MTDLPDPLTPADCDLRDFQFMPIDIVRLFSSRFHAIANDAEWRAGFTLWLKSFHQVPAGSIPDDDIELTRLAEFGRDVKSWKKVREVALHGWVKCSDGRFYHPVVSEKATESWERRTGFKEKRSNKTERQQRWRDRVKELSQQLRDRGVTPPANASLSTLESLLADTIASTPPSTVDATETAWTGTGTYSVSNDTGGEAEKRLPQDRQKPPPDPTPTSSPGDDDPNRAIWANGVAILGEAARPQIARWINTHGAEIVGEAFERTLVAKPGRPAGYIQSILTRLSQEARQRAEEQTQADALFDARYPPREMSEFEARALMAPEDFQRWQARQFGLQASST